MTSSLPPSLQNFLSQGPVAAMGGGIHPAGWRLLRTAFISALLLLGLTLPIGTEPPSGQAIFDDVAARVKSFPSREAFILLDHSRMGDVRYIKDNMRRALAEKKRTFNNTSFAREMQSAHQATQPPFHIPWFLEDDKTLDNVAVLCPRTHRAASWTAGIPTPAGMRAVPPFSDSDSLRHEIYHEVFGHGTERMYPPAFPVNKSPHERALWEMRADIVAMALMAREDGHAGFGHAFALMRSLRSLHYLQLGTRTNDQAWIDTACSYNNGLEIERAARILDNIFASPEHGAAFRARHETFTITLANRIFSAVACPKDAYDARSEALRDIALGKPANSPLAAHIKAAQKRIFRPVFSPMKTLAPAP